MKRAFDSLERPLWLATLLAGALTLPQSAGAATVIWNGAATPDLNWSTAGNWIGGVVPGATDDVAFYDDGADGTVGNPNNIVNASFAGTIGSLQYAQSNFLFHTTQIEAGKTLNVQGRLLVGTEATADQNVDAAVTGAGTLVVSNSAANMIVRQGGNATSRRATLDLSGLDTFFADVNIIFIGRGDPPGLPNINRNTGWLYLAKTNRIRAAAANTSLNVIGIEVGRSGSNNGSGSRLYLGQTNAIFATSLGVGLEKETACQMLFNPVFAGPVAYIRGSDGSSRMNLFTIGDGEANSGTTSAQGTVDFSNGTVDAQVDLMTIGRASSNTGGTGNSRGTLTLTAGIIDINDLRIGLQEATTGKNGDGTVNVNGGVLSVNNVMQLGIATGGAGVATTIGRLSVTAGTVMANAVETGPVSGGSFITMTGGTFILTNTMGSVSAPIGSVSLSDATIHFARIGEDTRISTASLTTGGAGNTLQIGTLPSITSYPAQFRLIRYTGDILGSDFNFTMSGLPGNYAGFLSNNVAEDSIDLVLTSGPIPKNVVWTGTAGGTWDTATANWLAGGNPALFVQGDLATFDDTAAGTRSVNLAGTVLPANTVINNSGAAYTFAGAGSIGGLGGLTKQGAGTLTIANSGANSYADGTRILGGTLQIGNGGTSGNLGGGNIENDAALVFNRSDNIAVNNDISGAASGSISKQGAGTLTLGGANTFTGNVMVTSGTLQAGSSTALGATNGSTTIAGGAVLDVAGQNLGAEPVTVSGAGTGAGAIVNSGAQQLNALRYVTLAGNTTFGNNPNRWDVRGAPSTADPANAALSTGGNPYTLTKIGANAIALVGVTVDPALADIHVEEGVLGVEAATTGLGNPASTLTVHAGATLRFFNMTNLLNKQFVLNGTGTNATLDNGSGANTVVGPMTLNGSVVATVGGTSLTLSNVLSGTGGLIKNGAGTLTLAGGADTYAGATVVSNGTLVINNAVTGGGTLTTHTNTTLAGLGSHAGTVDLGGALQPGGSGVYGTFTSGALTLQAGASLVFDLNSVTTVGAGVNDLLQVNGNLTANGNTININLLGTTLQAGTYRLINYTGAFSGSFNPTVNIGGISRYGLTIDTGTPGQVNLVVTGSAGKLVWTGAQGTVWDVFNTENWVNSATSLPDKFYQGDLVRLDDTAQQFTIDLSEAVSPSTITNDSGNLYVINGPGRITGGTTIVKRGAGQLSIASTNDFTGPVIVQEGVLHADNNAALGSTVGGTTIQSGASLDVGSPNATADNTKNLGTEPINVVGLGYGDSGAIVNNAFRPEINAVRVVNLMGDTRFGGNARWDIRGAGAALSTGGNAYNISKVGGNQISLVGVAVDPALGDIDVQGGILGIETTTSSAGNPARKINVRPGATLMLHNLAVPLEKVIVLEGDGSANTFRNNSGANVVNGPVTLSNSVIFSVVGTSLTLSNSVNGPGSLFKFDGSPLTLAGAVSYTGETTINGGTLRLVGNSAITASPMILLSSATTTLDVSGRTDGRQTIGNGRVLAGLGRVTGSLEVTAGGTVAPGNELQGVPVGTLTVTDVVTLGGTNAMQTDKFSLTNDLISGAAQIVFGGVLRISDVNAAEYADGDAFKLFDAASYSGAFAKIEPATPGAGLFWDVSELATSGTLKVVSTPQPPTISNVVRSGGNLVLSGSGGVPNGAYHVVTSTNLALPLASWTSIATNNFDASGNFTFPTPIELSAPQRFFLLRLP